MEELKPFTWIKAKYLLGGSAKQNSNRGGGDSSKRGRKKISAREKALLPLQPDMMMLVNAKGHARMVRVND